MRLFSGVLGTAVTVTLMAGSALPAGAAAPQEGVKIVAPDFDPSAVAVSSDSPEADVRVQDVAKETRSGCATRFAGTGPIGGAWSREYRWIGCSDIGANARAKKTYSFSAVPGQLAPGCGQGFGYKGGKTPYWASVGCYSNGGQKLDWGNVAGTPKFKVKTMIAVLASSNWWL